MAESMAHAMNMRKDQTRTTIPRQASCPAPPHIPQAEQAASTSTRSAPAALRAWAGRRRRPGGYEVVHQRHTLGTILGPEGPLEVGPALGGPERSLVRPLARPSQQGTDRQAQPAPDLGGEDPRMVETPPAVLVRPAGNPGDCLRHEARARHPTNEGGRKRRGGTTVSFELQVEHERPRSSLVGPPDHEVIDARHRRNVGTTQAGPAHATERRTRSPATRAAGRRTEIDQVEQ